MATRDQLETNIHHLVVWWRQELTNVSGIETKVNDTVLDTVLAEAKKMKIYWMVKRKMFF